MGEPVFGPEGVRDVFFNDKSIGDAEVSRLIVDLKRFPRLEALYLEHTQITDAVLNELADCAG